MNFKKTLKINLNSCCSSDYCCEPEEKSIDKSKCPVCKENSFSVNPETVKSLLKDDIKTTLKDKFYLCENYNCNVVYFSDKDVFYTKDLKIDVDFKNNSRIKYACYCNELTYGEVKEILKKHGKTEWAFVVKTAKGKINKSDCIHKNPYGTCCTSNSYKNAVKETGFEFKGGH